MHSELTNLQRKKSRKLLPVFRNGVSVIVEIVRVRLWTILAQQFLGVMQAIVKMQSTVSSTSRNRIEPL